MSNSSHFHPVLRMVLRLYPQDYRDRYGIEMNAFLEEELAGGVGGVAWWLRFAFDHLQASRAIRDRQRGRG